MGRLVGLGVALEGALGAMTRSKRNAHHWYMKKCAENKEKKLAGTIWDRWGPKMVSRGPLGEPKWDPKGTLEAKVVPRWTIGAPEGANANVSHPFVRPRGAQGDPRRPKEGPKGGQVEARGDPREIQKRSRGDPVIFIVVVICGRP